MGYIRHSFSKIGSSAGRANRTEFWYFLVFIFILNVILNVALPLAYPDAYMQTPGLGSERTMAEGVLDGFALLSFLCSLSLCARRSHDYGGSGCLGMVISIFLIGVLILGIKRGDPGPNRYGDGPFVPRA
jgi:uncharacterized membrane protein YhaH (DUF805 family)